MKYIKYICVLFVVASLQARAQDCEVKVASLKGSYDGGCKKSKADGKGMAKGTDSYEGDFRNGYPDGTGKYTWANGDWYEGEWKKGEREGQGLMHFAGIITADSVQKGFWKKDKYIGEYEHPYIIQNKSSKVTDVEPFLTRGNNHQVKFQLESITSGASSLSQIPKLKISNIDIAKGNFINRVDQDNLLKTSITILQNVEFPFRVRITFESHFLDIELLEAGSWDIQVKVQN